MNRRDFLQAAGAAGLGVLFNSKFAMAGPATPVLVLLELKGGNDGLNTLIPFADEAYYRHRPNLALPRDRVIPLTEKLALNPALKPLMQAWNSNDLALLQGVGYPEPNRSHFRSIAIWESGSGSETVQQDGWLVDMLGATAGAPSATDGLVVGNGMGPLSGGGLRVIAMQNPKQFFKRALKLEPLQVSSENASLAHIVKVQNHLHQAAASLRRQVQGLGQDRLDFPKSKLGRELELVAKVILSGASIPVIKVSHGSFDTHRNQAKTHDRLLAELAEGLAALRSTLIEAGAWKQVLISSYSEFGRRVAENGSRGTDHGTAAPHFIMGGRVKGGIYGDAPSLTRLEGGDLKYSTDFRQIYATIAEKWFDRTSSRFPSARYPELAFL